MIAGEEIVYRKSDNAAVLTMNRPAARNAITPRMLGELFEAVQDAAADKSLRVLTLRGAGADFCPGADIRHYAGGKAERSDPRAFTIPVILHEAPMVTVAAIKGACAGAALGFAAACDLRLADTTARFNSAFLDVGLSGDMGGPWLLPRILGAARARELYFLPGKFDGARALSMGLISRLLEPDVFEDELAALTERLATAAPLALKTMKANFLEAERMGFSDYIAMETPRHMALGASEDSREAFKAFLEKRKPRYQGR